MSRLPEKEQHKFLTVVWSAKEALYKLYGKSEVQMEHMTIMPFVVGNEGIITGKLELDHFQKEYELSYHFSDDGEYLLVYTIDETVQIKKKLK
jgi:phosphopantetheinyl transferase (holo-ACP synthase)